ncbi:MAG: DUF4876 domain-containing protein [Alistipes sp.]|nr:DUF4876 domain-containing protein [Alistipes sp.]
MKKLFTIMAVAVSLIMVSCETGNEEVTLYDVVAQLSYPADSGIAPAEGVEVAMKNSNGTVVTATTDATGKALLSLPEGVYEASASEQRTVNGYTYTFNALLSNVVVSAASYSENMTVTLDMVGSRAGQILIKELYVGGCQKDDGSGSYIVDKYMVIYNNSAQQAVIDNFCVGMAGPYNANTGTNNYVDGKLFYSDLGYTPTICAFWFMQKQLVMEPYESKVIALHGAIDHTTTYTNSVNLSNTDYCMYDPEVFANTMYYPAPSESIATDNYMKACFVGKGNAWPVSMVGPAMFIFSTGDNEPLSWGLDVANRYYFPGKEDNAVYGCVKIPNDWIMDAVEIFGADSAEESLPRFNPALDAGYIVMTNKQGYSIYRNVDQAATEAIEDNAGKIVYGYSKGTTDYKGANSTDPSAIDAEASIRGGAKIVYQDTNNTTNDFHQRVNASLKD